MCGFLTSSILIDEVSNYTGVILRIACFDLNCPLFTCLNFWHRLSSIFYWFSRIPKDSRRRSKTMFVKKLLHGHRRVTGHICPVTAYWPEGLTNKDFYGFLGALFW